MSGILFVFHSILGLFFRTCPAFYNKEFELFWCADFFKICSHFFRPVVNHEKSNRVLIRWSTKRSEKGVVHGVKVFQFGF